MDRVWLFAMVFGVLFLALSLLADNLGLGSEPGFDSRQAAGAVVGGGLIIGGLIARRIRQRKAAAGEARPPG
ncbi:hypothetical protein BH18GEM1_BH18GEM1_13060 [soil metagenome]